MANQKPEISPSPSTSSPSISSPAPALAKSERSGILPGVVHLALDVADRGQSAAIAVLQDARAELRVALETGVDFAEKLAASAFRFARKSISRVDDASTEALTGAGTVLSGAIHSARETTRAAAELATTATSGIAGPATAQA